MKKEVSKWNQLNAYLPHFCQYSIDSFFVNTVTVWNQNKKTQCHHRTHLDCVYICRIVRQEKTQSEWKMAAMLTFSSRDVYMWRHQQAGDQSKCPIVTVWNQITLWGYKGIIGDLRDWRCVLSISSGIAYNMGPKLLSSVIPISIK